MEEFEPKKKSKIIDKVFIAKYSYVLVLAVLLIGGISYSYTFFTQNRKIASGSITTAGLTVNFTDRSISATGLYVPADSQEGLNEFSKSLTITNQTAVNGKVRLKLTRTSGLALNDMEYGLVVNGAIQEVEDVPEDGVILSSAIMGNEVINVEVRLWPKTTYSGLETTFVGELTPDIKYLGKIATGIDSPTGKYVNFNCSSSCEVWQIVKIEDGRLVLTRQADYSNADSRINSNRYNSSLTFDDDSMITSVSTDDKNVYLAKTVKINGGDGTLSNPYELVNNDFREGDKKVIAVITYKDGATTLGTQNVYYNEYNYVSRTMDDVAFRHWTDGTNDYLLGTLITTINSDTDLDAVKATASTLTLTNNSVALTLGTNGENSYSYDGDGILSCASSDDTKVTCSVDSVNNKIVLVPVATTSTNVTITISGTMGVNYLAPISQTFTVTVSIPTISSCQGCKYLYTTTNLYTTWNTQSQTPTAFTTGVYDNYQELVSITGKDFFIGVKLNSQNQATNAYTCGIKDDVPFCIEGTIDGSEYNDNVTLLQGASLYNNTCTFVEVNQYYYYMECGPWDNVTASAHTDCDGNVDVGIDFSRCYVTINGVIGCE